MSTGLSRITAESVGYDFARNPDPGDSYLICPWENPKAVVSIDVRVGRVRLNAHCVGLRSAKTCKWCTRARASGRRACHSTRVDTLTDRDDCSIDGLKEHSPRRLPNCK